MAIHLIHTLRQESLEAYFHPSNQPRFGRQAKTIYDLIAKGEGYTRNEIAIFLNIKINAVCGRVRELLDAGWIVEDGKKKDKFSGMKNNILRLKKVEK